MGSDEISPLVAPDMGSFAQGIERFKDVKAPYARGGGTPATKRLEETSLLHLGKFTVSEGAFAPHVSIVASGQASNHLVFKALYGGDLVCSKHLFGTTKVDLQKTFIRSGGNVAWVDPCDTQAFIDNTNEKTNAWYAEAISNPAGRVPDLEALSVAAQEREIPLIVDMTLAAGMPKFEGLKYADVLTMSLTKQASGGENNHMGGAIIVGTDFPWEDKIDRYPELKEYFADASGNIVLPSAPFGALVSKIGLHEGSCLIAPNSAMSISDSLPGLEGRIAKQCENAKMLAEFLSEEKGRIESIQLAGYNTDAENDKRTKKYLGENHFVLLVDLKGGFEAARQFIDSGQFMHAVALGQQVTAVSNPPSSTHRQYSKEALADMGIHEGTLRISVGCEPQDELRQRMARALAL